MSHNHLDSMKKTVAIKAVPWETFKTTKIGMETRKAFKATFYSTAIAIGLKQTKNVCQKRTC